MSARKNVPAAAVRDFARTPEGAAALKAAGAAFPGSRGRLAPSTLAVFHKENPRLRYETGVAEAPTIEVPGVVSLDKAGRKVTKTVTVTTKEARVLMGHDVDKGKASKRGRFAKGDLALALSAANANAVADQFTK